MFLQVCHNRHSEHSHIKLYSNRKFTFANNVNVNFLGGEEMKISKTAFGTTPDGQPVSLYHMENSSGAYVEILDYGCRVMSICVPEQKRRTDGLADSGIKSQERKHSHENSQRLHVLH